MLSSESAAEDLKGKRTSARLSEPSTKLSDDTSTRLSETSHPSPFKSAAVPNVITVNGQGLFDQISLPGTALSLAIEEWDHLHSHNPSTAAVQLIGLLLWTAQIRDQSVSVEDLLEEDPPAVLERIHRGLQTRGSPNYPLKGRKNFKRSFVEFWTRLSTKLLMMTTTTTFDTFLLPWLLTTSASPYRPLRHAAALACLSVISGACKACTALSGELERTSKLAKSRQGSLPKQLAQQRASAERTIQVIFEGVFVQRFRDVDAAIRLDAIEQIPTWICGLSELFLDNAYLRYLGWALSDRDGDVRLVALEGLSTIYGVPSHLSCLGTFTDRFAPRILEMARSDVDGTVRKAAAKLLCRLHDEEMIEEEDLAFLDELLVKLRLPQNPPTITLFISHILAVEAKEWRRLGDEQVLLGIHDYIERIAAGLEVVEHLVYSLVDALPALKNLKAICALADKGTSTTASLYLLEAASRAFVYPPMAGRVRVVPTRPTGLEKSIELTRIIFPTVLQLFSFTIANGAVALADLTALLDFETIFTTDGLDHLKQLCALIVGLFERPDGGEADLIRCLKFCASFGPLETYVEGCLERLRDLLVAEALELAKDLDNGTNELAKDLDNGTNELAKDLDNGTNALSQPNKLLHLSHLLAVVPPHMAISTSLIRLAHQCETAMLSENTASQNAFIAALTISYQVLLWNLMEYRCSSFDPTSLADQIHAVLQLSAGWRDNDHRPRLVQQKLVPIWLDLIVLFGKADASPIRVTVEPADLIGCVELIHDWIDEQSVFWLGILNKLVFYEILPEASLPLLLSLHGVLGKAEAEITLRAFDMLKGRIEASRFAPILYDALIAGWRYCEEREKALPKSLNATAKMFVAHIKGSLGQIQDRGILIRAHQKFVSFVAEDPIRHAGILEIASAFISFLPPLLGQSEDARHLLQSLSSINSGRRRNVNNADLISGHLKLVDRQLNKANPKQRLTPTKRAVGPTPEKTSRLRESVAASAYDGNVDDNVDAGAIVSEDFTTNTTADVSMSAAPQLLLCTSDDSHGNMSDSDGPPSPIRTLRKRIVQL